MTTPIIIGTRGSDLALAQAHQVQGWLGGADKAPLNVIRTRGDELVDIDLRDSIEKGLFTSALEEALAAGGADILVHSLKDLPTAIGPGLGAPVLPIREAPADVLLVRPDALVSTENGVPVLKPGATIGTSSNRRTALCQSLLGDVKPVMYRGNVPTRVSKCLRGDADAIVLARAGLSRLALDPGALVAFDLDPTVWTPAPGQGALGLQGRANDARTDAVLAGLADASVARTVRIERHLLSAFGGGCHAAFGAFARLTQDESGAEGINVWVGQGTGEPGTPEARWEVAHMRLAADATPEDAADVLRVTAVLPVETLLDEQDSPWIAPAVPWWTA